MPEDPFDLSWFEPEPAQLDFITGWPKESMYAGGVGSGKTLSGCVKGLLASTQWPGTVGLVGRQTYRALEDTTKKVMLDGDDKPPVIPPQMIEYRNDLENRVVVKGGSEILFRSLEDYNIEKLLSLNLGWFYVDEATETTLKIWLTLMGRLRHPLGPRTCWGTTNPNGHDWVWRRYHADGGEVERHLEKRKLIVQPTAANSKHLAADYIEMLEDMPEPWKKRFVYANFDTAAGMIWDKWHRNVHVYEQDLVGELPSHWKRFRAMDHGHRQATCVLWFVVDPDGNIIVEDEYYEPGKLPSDHAPVVAAKTEMLAPGIKYGPILAPPDCFRLPATADSTIADEYRDATDGAVILTHANDNVKAGLLRVDEWMKRDDGDVYPDWHPLRRTYGVDNKGAPRIFVSSRCTNLIREVPDYRWKDLSPTAEKDKDEPEEPRKKEDHACDALRYGVMSRPRPRIEHPKTRDRTQGTPALSVGLRTRDF